VISAELYDQKLRDKETSEAEVANQEKEVRAATSSEFKVLRKN
jgi:hypothetical protein